MTAAPQSPSASGGQRKAASGTAPAVIRPTSNGTVSSLWFIAAGVAFALASIMQSMRQGQLAAPATYDDITYFVDAGRRLLGFYNAGFPSLFEGYLRDPPHAPMSTATSFIGFLLFGFHDWSQALVNTVWVVALLLVIRRWFAGLPAFVTASVVIAVLAWPVLGFLVIEGRPDIVNGFLLAFGCIGLVERPWVTAGRGRLLAIALLFAAALLTKPSVFPITIALYGVSLAVATGLDYLDSGRMLSIRSMLARNATAAGITLVVVLPHYIVGIGHQIEYILRTTFTTEKDLWAVKLPPYEQATFYLWGEGGRQTMAAWVFVTAALVALAIAGLVVARDRAALRRVAGMALVFAVSFAFVSIPAHKSAFLGVQVTAFCLVFFLIAGRAVFTAALASGRGGKVMAVLLAAGLVATALSSFQWHWFHRTGRPSVATAEELAKRHALIDAVHDAVRPQGETASKVYFPAAAYYLNDYILDFAFVRDGDADDDAFDDHRSGDLAAHLANIKTATHVVLLSPDDPDVLNWLPSATSLGAVREAVAADPAFVKVASLQPIVSGGPIEIYARKTALATLAPGAGFQALEGPYPQWNLPRFRWVSGAGASLAIVDPTPGAATLRLELQSPVADQRVTATIGGRRQGDCPISTAYVTTTCAIPVAIEAGDRTIELSFAKTDPSNDQKRAVMVFNQSLLR